MEPFNWKITARSGRTSPIDSQRNHPLKLSRSRYPFNIDSPTFDPLAMDPPLIQYYRTNPAVAAASGLVSPPLPTTVEAAAVASPTTAIDPEKIHQLLNLSSSSRGSSSSPLSAIENLQTSPSRSPPVFSTPVKVEEDVLVMDGILMKAFPGSSAKSSFDSGSASSSSLYKTDICRFWEDTGSCRLGSKCQYAHGKEELRSTRPSGKNKAEGPPVCKTFAIGGSCAQGTRCCFAHCVVAAAPQTASSPTVEAASQTVSTTTVAAAPQIASTTAVAAAPQTVTTNIRAEQQQSNSIVDWSPIVDGVLVGKPASSSSAQEIRASESVDACITDILYGPRRTRRLPIFKKVCPE